MLDTLYVVNLRCGLTAAVETWKCVAWSAVFETFKSNRHDIWKRPNLTTLTIWTERLRLASLTDVFVTGTKQWSASRSPQNQPLHLSDGKLVSKLLPHRDPALETRGQAGVSRHAQREEEALVGAATEQIKEGDDLDGPCGTRWGQLRYDLA